MPVGMAPGLVCILLILLNMASTVSSIYRPTKDKTDTEILDDLLNNEKYEKRMLPRKRQVEPLCEQLGCEHQCQVNSEGKAQCLCPDEFTLNQASTSCDANEGIIECDQNKCGGEDKGYCVQETEREHTCYCHDPYTPSSNGSICEKETGPMVINVSVLLLTLSSPDESSLKYEVEFLMHQTWIDSRLKFNDSGMREYLNAIQHLEDIWIPDTFFVKHGDFKTPIVPSNIALRVFSNGTVQYTMRRHLILTCVGRLYVFPFDDPSCSFSIESISHEKHHLMYEWQKNPGNGKHIYGSAILKWHNAYIISNKTAFCEEEYNWRGNYSCLNVTITFTRDKWFYFSTVFIPGMILVTSSFITFWLDWNAVPARVMIGVTTMLNFFTTSNTFRSNLPAVSNLTAMNVWDAICMIFIYASLLEFVVVNYIGRKRPRFNAVYRPGENPVIHVMHKRIPEVTHRIGETLMGPLLHDRKRDHTGEHDAIQTISTPNPETTVCGNCGTEPCSQNSNNSVPNQKEHKKKEPPHPIRIAKTIDVISRICFPTAFAIFMMFFFLQFQLIR